MSKGDLGRFQRPCCLTCGWFHYQINLSPVLATYQLSHRHY